VPPDYRRIGDEVEFQNDRRETGRLSSQTSAKNRLQLAVIIRWQVKIWFLASKSMRSVMPRRAEIDSYGEEIWAEIQAKYN
jgi:hypothetical protein